MSRIGFQFVPVPVSILEGQWLSMIAKILFAVLLKEADEAGRCSIGVRLLCRKLGTSDGAIRRATKHLDAAGLIRVAEADPGTRFTYHIQKSALNVTILPPVESAHRTATLSRKAPTEQRHSENTKRPHSDGKAPTEQRHKRPRNEDTKRRDLEESKRRAATAAAPCSDSDQVKLEQGEPPTKSGPKPKAKTKAKKKSSAELDWELATAAMTGDILRCERFRVAWAEWCQHRREIRKVLKPTMIRAQIRKLEKLGVESAIAMIEHTVFHGWWGLRKPDDAARHGATARDVGGDGLTPISKEQLDFEATHAANHGGGASHVSG